MISISEKAKNYLVTAVKTQDKKYAYLAVNGGGCSGFQYEWDMTDDLEKGTLIENILVLDRTAEMFVIGCTIDYVTEFGGSYLKVINPNATAQCGCGESFAV
jgi:iron-sulfur cluster assembly accessory protein|tara:strand:- start:608 stop:913 length:306 start_codon:yes stop_codon:yes gene_type:complete